MSNTSRSTNPNLAKTKPKTMAALRALMLADTSLKLSQRRSLAWGVSAVARGFKQPMDTMPADPRFISEQLEGFAPAMAGLTPGAWKNAVHLTRSALRRAGVIKDPGRQITRFAPAWTAVMKLPPLKHQQLALSRLARFCSNQGIAPDDVSDATFDSFREELLTNTVMKKARKVHQRAAVVWNTLANTVPNWPTQLVTVPSYSKTYFVGWDTFPASLVAEIEEHIAQLSGADILSDLPSRPLKPSSLRTRRHQLGQYLSGMVLSGEAAANLTSLAEALRPDRVRVGLTFLLKRVDNKTTDQAHDVARMLLSVAKHWVKAPDPVLDTLRGFCKKLEDRQPKQGLSSRNMKRLRQFDETDAMNRLIGLPAVLLEKASKTKGKPTQADALLVQTALCVEILLMIPIRRENLTRLDIEKHFIRHNSGAVYLMIDAEEVKNQVAIEARLPAETVKLLDLYIAKYRPVLAAVASPWLIPGLPGRHKSRERLALQITETIKRETGLEVNLHLFRHASAKFYLDRNPGAYGVVQKLLGHKSLQTTIRNYCGLEAKSAIAHYDQMILSSRSATGKQV